MAWKKSRCEDYPDGYIYLPDGLGDEWIKQLVAEELRFVKLRNGGVRREWHKVRDRNEALDNAIYARAVAIGIGVDRWTARQWQKATGEMTPPRDAPPSPTKAADQASTDAPPLPSPTNSPPRGKRNRRENPYTSRRR